MTIRKNPIHSSERLTLANPLKTTVREYFGPFLSKTDGRQIGIEIEIETSNDHYPKPDRMDEKSKFWSSVNDGSLRTSKGEKGGGREFICRRPIPFDKAEEALIELQGFLKTSRSKVKYSNRTSVHVHVNVQDMTLTELVNALCVYYIAEPLMGRYNGFERENNLHALPISASPHLIESLIEFLRTQRVAKGLKYSALNYMNLYSGGPRRAFGTLEFRQGRGITSEPTETLEWINLIQTIFTAAQGFKSPLDIIEELSAYGPTGFFKRHLPNLLGATLPLFEEGELEGKVMESMRVAQALAYDIDWGEYVPEKALPTGERKKDLYAMHAAVRGFDLEAAEMLQANANREGRGNEALRERLNRLDTMPPEPANPAGDWF